MGFIVHQYSIGYTAPQTCWRACAKEGTEVCQTYVSMNVKYWYKCPLFVPLSHFNNMVSIACPVLTAGNRYDKHGVQSYSTLKIKPSLGLKKNDFNSFNGGLLIRLKYMNWKRKTDL